MKLIVLDMPEEVVTKVVFGPFFCTGLMLNPVLQCDQSITTWIWLQTTASDDDVFH